MLPSHCVPQLDRWLAAASRRAQALDQPARRPSLSINGMPGAVDPAFATQLAAYLSSVDDLATDGWRAFDTPTIEELAVSPLQILSGKALAQRDACSVCACPGDGCGTRKKRAAAAALLPHIVRSGDAILQIPGGCQLTGASPSVFHVWFSAGDDLRLQRLKSQRLLPQDAGPAALAETDAAHLAWIRDALAGSPVQYKDGNLCANCHLSISMPQMADAPLVQIIGDAMLEWAAAVARSNPQNLRGVSQPLRSAPRSTVLPFPTPARIPTS